MIIDYNSLLKVSKSQENRRQLLVTNDFFSCPEGLTDEEHSRIIDRLLGFRVAKIEQNLLKKYQAFYKVSQLEGKQKYPGTQTWIGLHPHVLQTPYSEFYELVIYLRKFRPKIIIDFGSAYGRLGVVMKALMPESDFFGHEIVEERARECRRVYEDLGIVSGSVTTENILLDDFVFPKGDVYFIYDFSVLSDVKKIVRQLLDKALSEERFLMVVRGKGISSLVQERYPQFSLMADPVRRGQWTVYRNFISPNDLNKLNGETF